MKTARDLMTSPAECLAPTATLAEAARHLSQHDVGSMPVTDGDLLVGVVTDRDIVVKGIAVGLDPASATVAEIATPDVVTVGVDHDAKDVARILAENQIRRIPVVEEGRVVGIIAQADIARTLGDRLTGDIVEDISR